MNRLPDDITKHIANLQRRISVLERPRSSTKTQAHTHLSGEVFTITKIPHGLGYTPATMGWLVVPTTNYIQMCPQFEVESGVVIFVAVIRADPINIEFLTYYNTVPDRNLNFVYKYSLLGETAIL